MQKKEIENYRISSGKRLQNLKTVFENFDIEKAIEKAAKYINLANLFP